MTKPPENSGVCFIQILTALIEFSVPEQFFANQSYKHPYTTILSIPTDFTLSIYHDPKLRDVFKTGVEQWN